MLIFQSLLGTQATTSSPVVVTPYPLYGWGYNLNNKLGQNSISTTAYSYPVSILSGTSWKSFATGINHSVAIKSDGTLWAWGKNDYGQIGLDKSTNRRTSLDKLDNSSWTMIRADASHTAGIKSDGSLWTWGDNTSGQLGLGDVIARSSPVQVGTSSWSSVSTGDKIMIAIRTDNTLWSWGLGTSGELGINTATSRSSPTQIGTSAWTSVAIGQSDVVGITTAGNIFTWGAGVARYLADAGALALSARSSPVQVTLQPFKFVRSLGGSYQNVVLIDDQYRLWGWGRNDGGGIGGYLGLNDTVNRLSPVLINSTGSWTMITNCGGFHYAGIKSDGSLWTWGWNDVGQLGLGDTFNRSSPTQVGSSSWTMVSAGNKFTTAININGQIFSWGSGTLGSLGNNAATDRSSPVQLASTSSFNIVSAGAYHAIARTINNKLWTWGYGNDGVLGNSSVIWRSSPVAINTTTSYNALSAGAYHNLAITSAGNLQTWGNGTYGQLGNTSTLNRSAPVTVGALTTWTKVSAGAYHSLAVTENAGTSTLYHFGQTGGSAGNGATANTNSPVAVYTSTVGSPTPYAMNQFLASLVVTSDGNLFGSGENTTYSLALADTPSANTTIWKMVGHSPPASVGAITLGAYPTAGFEHGHVVIDNSKLFSWGNNASGQLGDSSTVSRSKATLVFSDKTFSSVVGGDEYTLGVTSDGKLWGWGINTTGQIGLGDAVNRSSPVQVGSSSWTVVSAGRRGSTVASSAGITIDGRLWAWGKNYDYQPLGVWGPTGVLTHRSTPLQIGTRSNYVAVSIESSGNPARIVAINSLREAYWQGDGIYLAINDYNVDSPVQVGSDTDWESVSIGGIASNVPHTLALKTNKTLWTWGADTYGNLGLGNVAGGARDRSTPTQVPAGSGPANGSWNLVAGGYNFAYGIDTSNVLWTWGYNYTGGGLGLGVATAGFYNTPQRVTKARSFTHVELGYDATAQYTTVAIDSLNNETWSWGGGTMGLGGMQTTTVYASPSLVPTSSWSAISIGDSHSVAIKTDGSLWTWGSNSAGQLGTNSTLASRVIPGQIMTGSSFSVVSAGLSHSAAIDVVGRLFIWGLGSVGRLGTNDTFNRSSPTVIASDKSWVAVAAGSHTVAVTSTGEVWAWGDNARGQLGVADDTYVDRSSPVQVSGASSAVKVSVGIGTTSYVDSSARAYFLGYDRFGLSTRGTAFTSLDQQLVPFSETLNNMGGSWTMVAATSTGEATVAGSQDFGLGIKTDGSLWSWGGNTFGQLGDGTEVAKNNSAKKIGSSSWTFVAAAASTAAAIDAAGRLFTWGDSLSGKTAVGDIIDRSSPTQVPGSWNFVTIHDVNGVGIKTNGTLWTWGSGAFGKLGNESTISRSSPVQVAGTWTTAAIVSRSGAAVIGIQGGKVYGWGAAGTFMTGGIGSKYSSADDRSSPVAISMMTYDGVSATAVAGGTLGAVAYRLSDGTLWTWGDNVGGILGNNTQADLSFPAVLGQSLSWTNFSLGWQHAMAVRSDGTLWAWGSNSVGQLGISNTFDRSSPVQVGALTNWSEVSVGNRFNLARKTDGTLWSWGVNSEGQLGLSDTINRSSPVQVGTSSWSAISTGWSVSGGISAFRMFTWGNGNSGRLGLLDTINRSSPTQVGTSSWTAISIGDPNSLAISLGGSLFAWGGNDGYGTLGQNDTINRSSPVQIGTSSWSIISAGYYGAMGITTAGSLWAWGSNSQGRLGVGDDRNRSVPTQVGALTGWTGLGKSIITEVNTAIRGTNLYAMGAVDTLVNGRSSPVLVGVGQWKNSCTTQYAHAVIYNDSMILTEAYDQYNFVSNSTWAALGSNSTTTNPWNTSSRVILPLSRGHRAWINEPIPWTNNISMHQTFKATKSNGTLWTWGAGANGLIGDGGLVNRSSPVQVGAATNWNTGSTKFFLNCGSVVNGELTSTGQAYGWGDAGSVGHMLVKYIQTPTQISGSWSAVALSRVTNYYAAGIKTDGTLWTWGDSVNALGLSDVVTTRSSPTQVGTKSTWTKVALGGSARTAAIGDSGQTVYSWGSDMGGWSQTTASSPVALFADNIVAGSVYPSVQGSFTLVLSTSGSLYAIGAQKNGEFGDNGIMGTTGASPSGHIPRKIDNGTWRAMAAGNSHSLGIKTDGSLWGFGLNSSGQLGQSDTIIRSSPVAIMSGRTFNSISAGTGYSLAVANNGIMWAFGIPTNGVLGNSSVTANRSLPVQVGENWTMISSGLSHVMLIDSEGGLWTWGSNSSGQLGLNDTTSRIVLSKVGTSSWSFVSAGDSSTHAITINGTLWTWGDNANGNLGLNDTINRSTPTQIGNGSWSFVHTRTSVTSAIDSTGKLWAWGINGSGQLGNNNTINRSSPVQVSGAGQSSSFTIVRTGNNAAVAVTTDGTMYGWGLASVTGQNSSVVRSQPILISSGWSTDRDKITMNNDSVIAIKSDGSLWSWGINTFGQLGVGDTITRSSPAQVGTSSWTFVTGASNGSARVSAIDTAYRTFSWGNNSTGALGVGDTLGNRSSPTLVTNTVSFTLLSYTSTYTLAIQAGTKDRYYWGSPGTSNGIGTSIVNRSNPGFLAGGRVGSWVAVKSSDDGALATKTE